MPPGATDAGLLPWAGDATVARAAARLVQQGYVVISADSEAKGLPPPLPEEVAASVLSAHPRGFLVRRGIARRLAAQALGGNAEDHPIWPDAAGAPRFAGAALQVSFSARGTTGLIALGRLPLGVDYEPSLPAAGIPWNLLRPEERLALEAMPPERQAPAFLHLWRAKEATLKALGLGFSLPPEAVTVGGQSARVEGYPPSFRLVHWSEAGLTVAFSAS